MVTLVCISTVSNFHGAQGIDIILIHNGVCFHTLMLEKIICSLHICIWHLDEITDIYYSN